MSKRILLVGGVFDFSAGRRSGYVEKLYDEIIQYFGVPYVEYRNGGHYQELFDLVYSDNKWDCIIWMPDIDNSAGKLLPHLTYRMRGALIIQSKLNNGRYTKQQLLERMEQSEADLFSRMRNNPSGTKGVFYDKHHKKFKVSISINAKLVHLGYYEDIEDAKNIRSLAERKKDEGDFDNWSKCIRKKFLGKRVRS